jgi:flagella basal body P-ring formation protein FlgA
VVTPALALALLVAAVPPAAAAPVSGAEAVALVAQAMAQAGAGAPNMPVPLRALPPCDHVPRVAPFQGRWTAAELACDSPQAWRRVLRTGAAPAAAPQATPAAVPVPQTPPVLTAARPLRRGAVVLPGDLVPAPQPRVDPAQALDDPALAVGRRLRTAVGAGQPLLERHLDPLHLVEPGQRVGLVLLSRGFSVTAEGVALGGGGLGAVVAVEVLPGGRRIEAEVAGPRNLIVRPKIR